MVLFLVLKSKERKWQIDCGLEGEIVRVKVLLDPTEKERERERERERWQNTMVCTCEDLRLLEQRRERERATCDIEIFFFLNKVR